ncbi:M48 family metalloprotease [Altererythrobacter sp. Root672]|uniref:M48 family metalloprotease n=1 Tax=Altererythrobacter sp. Root672 TaxID=1736584 RepID=UPI0006FF1199|nr:M48 family metalloprotease [Altererythrobacter sp. Root672]KRA81610.1 peptidase M48 [Altererythrobacter sp. Root672]
MRPATSLLARLLAFAALLVIGVQPVAAQSILRDAETEALLQDLVEPITEAAGLQKGAVDVVLLDDPSINAFVAGGQRIYIHSGLINAADNANMVQGVLAHEMGHITGGHIISGTDSMGKAMKIQLLSMLAGIAAAVAGAGDAAMAAMALGQQAALGNYLSFSRTQESSADAAGVQYLSKAGITGKGSLAFFQKLQNQEFRYGYSQSDEAGFARTHPLSGDRLARLELDYRADPAWDTPPDPEQQERFLRIKAKLFGYLATPQQTLNSYPTYMTSVPARYARAYAYHKESRMEDALAETDALIAADPKDPYFLELKGQVLLESGKPAEALEPLRQSVEMTNNDPLIATTFAHALLATEDQGHLEEAEKVLRAAVGRDRENPSAWYQLGVVYGARGDIPRARLASAEQQIMSGRPREALQNAESAEHTLPQGTSDWIRAQDVAMQARAELENERNRR